MITGTLAAIFVVAIIAAWGNGEWGVVIAGVVIVVLLLTIGAVSREDDRAYNNRVRYWAEGGPDRKKRD